MLVVCCRCCGVLGLWFVVSLVGWICDFVGEWFCVCGLFIMDWFVWLSFAGVGYGCDVFVVCCCFGWLVFLNSVGWSFR